ncbi:MAG: helix-turn-helix transcriptional regulator [Halobacterium sp.]
MHRGLACWVAGLLVFASVLAPAAAPAAGASTGGTPDGPLVVGQEEFQPDNVTLSASLQPDGSAAWSFKYRMELATQNETEAFESLQQDIENNRSAYVDRFRSRIESTVASAENATGRNMSVSNVSIRAFQQPGGQFVDSYGFVEYTFEWEGFAATEGERVVAGDALEGFYLNSETALQFSWPDSYRAVEVDPQPDQSTSTSVRWAGEEDFGTNQPRLVIEPEPAGGTTTTDGGTATTTAAAPSEGGGGVLLPVLVGGVVAVVVLGGAAYLYWRREYGEQGGAGAPASTEGGDGGGGEGGAGGEEAAGAAGAAAGAPADDTPEELLSNEERVKRFLREQGGRAKQQAVVEAMGWTEAKTSQVVKDMRENDELESFRIGRENVLKLPDADQYEEQ